MTTRRERRIRKYRQIRHGQRRDRLYELSEREGQLWISIGASIPILVVARPLSLGSPWTVLVLSAAFALLMTSTVLMLFVRLRTPTTDQFEIDNLRTEIVEELRAMQHEPMTGTRSVNVGMEGGGQEIDVLVCRNCRQRYHRWASLMSAEEAEYQDVISVTRRCNMPSSP